MDSLDFELGLFGTGLGVGLLAALYTWFSNWRKQSTLRQENEDLKSHLYTQMSINAKGYEELKQELETLKKANENLRVTVATLSNKPGRAELKTLHLWDKAIRILTVKLPGFAPAWETAIAEASKDLEDTESGMKAIVRKVFPMLSSSDSYAETSPPELGGELEPGSSADGRA